MRGRAHTTRGGFSWAGSVFVCALLLAPLPHEPRDVTPLWGCEFTTKAATLQGIHQNSSPGLNVIFCDLLVRAAWYPSTRNCLRWSKNNLEKRSFENLVVEYDVAGRAGAIRAIASSTPPHVCPRQGHPRPTPKFVPQSQASERLGLVKGSSPRGLNYH